MYNNMPFGLKLTIINRVFRKKMDEKASTLGLTDVQLRVLSAISRLQASGKEEIHQNDLERIEHVTHPAMTKLLQRLECKGFIKCVPSRFDRRYKSISCTEQSIGIHKTISEYDAEVFSELCKSLSREEKETFLQIANQILENIEFD